ncbi:MAG: ATP-binding protein [Nostocaceae cyanobacterium]|nr:ATP-binding protein [Nostocaceae cyanobacterium]
MNTGTISNYQGNILIVDDTAANLRLLSEILAEKGYKVRPVPNGELALSAAKGFPPDLILLDIMMPGINGYEVCKKLKADERTCDIPVIFISAINEVLDKVKAFGVGGVDYITKPFQLEEVLVRVETHLSLRILQKNMQEKNDELSKTLHQLQATQEQLIQSEKMAALGQLVAGIAHEINNPLGVVRSSVNNITAILDDNLEKLPAFFQSLSPERYSDFLNLLHKSINQTESLSTREKRQIKRNLKQELEALEVENLDNVTTTLVNLGVFEDIQAWLPLLKHRDSENILKMVYALAILQKSSKNICTATDRAAKVVFALRNYARYDQSGEKIEANVIDGIETVLTLYYNQLKHGIEVIKNYREVPPIFCYPDELNQVWTNLIHNAIQAMEYKGTLMIDVTQQNHHIFVSITDDGKGITPEIMPKIFEPFFTTKSAGEGSGLGLDIVRKIIAKHQGEIKVESLPGKTTFTVYLPSQL